MIWWIDDRMNDLNVGSVRPVDSPGGGRDDNDGIFVWQSLHLILLILFLDLLSAIRE